MITPTFAETFVHQTNIDGEKNELKNLLPERYGTHDLVTVTHVPITGDRLYCRTYTWWACTHNGCSI